SPIPYATSPTAALRTRSMIERPKSTARNRRQCNPRDLLQQTPHGSVHCAMVTGSCPNGLMGSVPVSALDPIFYAHHTNIDRLYECWLKVDETARLPSNATHLNAQFTFVDADGSTPLRRVSDMLRLSQLGYSYAAGGDCPAAAVAVAAGGATMADSSQAA